MASTAAIILITLGAIIVAALAFYAGKLLWQLQQQRQQQAEQQQELTSERKAYLTNSIVLICKAMLEGQCELSEGALRLWVLLDHLVPERTPEPNTTYSGLYQMYLAVKDMPTHEARNNQDKALTKQQDKIRLQAEQDLKSAILADTQALLTRFQPD
ncbi:DUF2489 domain-containing protein [Rheinheimera sp. MMS21-TC3]|uniref:DUF2489 domain-containing protein n=1 Tax=Rheinheimera sp. MMS21-TC3 TaxID=3072790 RepID=UPI0028C44769|nr:DUF2489 domain-containing protein [Rheinheimera sp. MMS21-TC3]WNO59570.1 DUF2489 domain-containing protein [Rheinheimera sp. MMS21-TC3]